LFHLVERKKVAAKMTTKKAIRLRRISVATLAQKRVFIHFIIAIVHTT